MDSGRDRSLAPTHIRVVAYRRVATLLWQRDRFEGALIHENGTSYRRRTGHHDGGGYWHLARERCPCAGWRRWPRRRQRPCRGTADVNNAAGRRDTAARRFVYDQELLSRSEVLARQALRALQHAAAAYRHVGAREPARSLGRLQPRSSDRQDREPVSLQDRSRALPGADGRSEESGWSDEPHAAVASRLGRLVSARRQRGAVDLGP